MIKANHITFSYENALNGAAVTDINIEIPDGQVVLLCGVSGSGKTTLGRLINGLIPSYYEGDMKGNLLVNGKDTRQTELYELAPFIGSVFQNPKSQFYTLQTDTEIVFACENMGLDKTEILNRFDNTVQSLQIENLVGKNLFALSGGEKQKIACASVYALLPDIFVLDEPTSNLDIKTIQEMRKVLLLWKKQGKTIIIAEHRLAWLKGIADRVFYFRDGQIAQDIPAEKFWDKPTSELYYMGLRANAAFNPKKRLERIEKQSIEIKNFKYSSKKTKILEIPYLKIPQGAVVAVLGNNGAGKTTFARCLCGLAKKAQGILVYGGKEYHNKERVHLCYMVMQDVNHQLFSESVMDEVIISVKESSENREALAENILSELDLQEYAEVHPMSLSGGQKQRVAIASSIATDKEFIVFDEPTSGLDYQHMKEVAKSIDKLSNMGKTQFIITHDPELVSECCNYFIFLDNGTVVNSGVWNEENIKYIAKFFGDI